MKRTPLSIATVLLATCICGSESVAAQEEAYKYEGNTVTFHARKFETRPSGKMDTMRIIDPITEEERIKVIEFPPEPIALYGRKIYNINDVATAPWNDGIALPLEEHLLSKFKSDPILQSFTDGTFSLNLRDIIIDEQGRVIYYELERFIYTGTDGQPRQLNMQGIDQWLQTAPALKAPVVNGKNVMARLNTSLSDNYTITIKNHEITATRK